MCCADVVWGGVELRAEDSARRRMDKVKLTLWRREDSGRNIRRASEWSRLGVVWIHSLVNGSGQRASGSLFVVAVCQP